MKAVVHDRYGAPDVLRIEDVPKAVAAPDEILVRICATGPSRTSR
jgi:NADPH:quinone reductase-like Zn-dependent oxidoreductase